MSTHSKPKSTSATPEIATRQESTLMSASESIASSPSSKTVDAAPAASTALTAAAPAAPAPVVVIAGPPSGVNIPTIAYAPATPGQYRTVIPQASERTALTQALKDLANFTTYQQTLGTTAPAYAEVMQALTVGAEWTAMRALSSNYDGYCAVQEGLAWQAIRLLMAQLVPIFMLAAAANPKLLTQYPGLASLLGAKKTIAKKGASTKTLNKKATAEGKPAIHGVVGKRNQRRAEKAAAATLAAGGAVATPSPVAVAQPQPAAVVAPSAALSPPANGATNGTTH